MTETATAPDGTRIAWEREGSGPPLVLIHGITDDRRSWDDIVPLLRERYTCIRVDLRGHGESGDASDYNSLLMASDIASVVGAASVTHPFVVGHSLGAAVATVFASANDVAGVVNVDQGLRISEMKPLAETAWPVLSGPGLGEFLTSMFWPDVEPLGERWHAHYRDKFAKARADVITSIWGLIHDSSVEDLDALMSGVLGTIRAPYLAIHGSALSPGYEGWITALCPAATLEVWPDQGHFVHMRNPERFAERVDAFLSQ